MNADGARKHIQVGLLTCNVQFLDIPLLPDSQRARSRRRLRRKPRSARRDEGCLAVIAEAAPA